MGSSPRSLTLGWASPEVRTARRACIRRVSVLLACTLGLLLPCAGSAHGDITVTPSPPVAGQTTTFKHSSRAFCCRWTFGDGATFGQSFTRNGGDNTARHVYGSLGQYRVTASGHHETTSGRLGEPFSDAITIQVGDPRDPSAPTVELQVSGPIRHAPPLMITGVSASSRLQWRVVARDPDSSMSVLRLLVAITARCRDVITGGSSTANYGFDSQALPTLLDPHTITHSFSLTLGEIITTAAQACQPPFSLAGFAGSARVEAVNQFGATTKLSRALAWEPRLNVIAYNLGGGTDTMADGERQHNRDLDGILPRLAHADVALLQEVRESRCPPLYQRCHMQPELIRERTPLKHSAWARGPRVRTGAIFEYAGPGIFSRFPLRNPRFITRPDKRPGTLGAVLAEARIGGVNHLLVSVHYSLDDPTGDSEQALVGRRINQFVHRFRGPVVIGGDFNSGPEGRGQGAFLASGPFDTADKYDRRPYDLYRGGFMPPPGPFFSISTDDPDNVPGGNGCGHGGLDYIYWRGVLAGARPFTNYQHHVYEQRCTAVPNSNHPLLMARLR
jgi:endonuclease/exonuclease/phosphatase family metal-dependent hydrolase